jgi:hypothetical protein
VWGVGCGVVWCLCVCSSMSVFLGLVAVEESTGDETNDISFCPSTSTIRKTEAEVPLSFSLSVCRIVFCLVCFC